MFQILCFNTNWIFIHFLNLFILRHAKWGSQRQKEWCLALYICILDNINMSPYLLLSHSDRIIKSNKVTKVHFHIKSYLITCSDKLGSNTFAKRVSNEVDEGSSYGGRPLLICSMARRSLLGSYSSDSSLLIELKLKLL